MFVFQREAESNTFFLPITLSETSDRQHKILPLRNQIQSVTARKYHPPAAIKDQDTRFQKQPMTFNGLILLILYNCKDWFCLSQGALEIFNDMVVSLVQLTSLLAASDNDDIYFI